MREEPEEGIHCFCIWLQQYPCNANTHKIMPANHVTVRWPAYAYCTCLRKELWGKKEGGFHNGTLGAPAFDGGSTMELRAPQRSKAYKEQPIGTPASFL